MPNLYRISFVGDYGWVIGEGGPLNGGRLVWRTTNFGISWDSIARVPYPGTELNYSVCFTSQNTGYCGGSTGYIFKSTNGGFNWYRQVFPGTSYRGDFWFANDSLGWSVGGGGAIYKTTNGGTYVGLEPISSEVPLKFELYQNYPNPFNSSTVIEFDIKENDYYKLCIYDVLGRMIEEVISNYLEPGSYKINYNAGNLSSGIYFYVLSSVNYSLTKKFTLIK
jgi:hypothetical protein